MRFSLHLEAAGYFFFDTLPDMMNALSVANVFKPFEGDIRHKAIAFVDEDNSVDLVITGIKFEDYISFGLDDETRRAYDKFEMEHRELV